jgi:hypothetical protein
LAPLAIPLATVAKSSKSPATYVTGPPEFVPVASVAPGVHVHVVGAPFLRSVSVVLAVAAAKWQRIPVIVPPVAMICWLAASLFDSPPTPKNSLLSIERVPVLNSI